MSPTIGKKLQILRKNEGMSQQELAEKLNVSRQTIGKWEGDLSLPDIESLVKISEQFNTSINELLEIETNNNERIPVTYEQIQTVLTNLQKENKVRTFYQIFMMLICIISLALMVSMKSDLNRSPDEPIILETDRPSSLLFYNERSTYTINSDLFVNEWGGKYQTYTNISEYNFVDETITLDYQFVLKESSPQTTVAMEFTGSYENQFTITFEKIEDNIFICKETIPLDLYHSINLKISNDNNTIVEPIVYNEDSQFFEIFAKYVGSFFIPVDENNALQLDTINYMMKDNLPFEIVGTPTGTFTLRLYDANHEPLTPYIYSTFNQSRTIELYEPLPLNQKIYIEFGFDFSIENLSTTHYFNNGYGGENPSIITEYFIINDSSEPYIICG